MGHPNRYLDVTKEKTTFPATALYDDNNGGESYFMIVQGPWFDLHAL